MGEGSHLLGATVAPPRARWVQTHPPALWAVAPHGLGCCLLLAARTLATVCKAVVVKAMARLQPRPQATPGGRKLRQVRTPRTEAAPDGACGSAQALQACRTCLLLRRQLAPAKLRIPVARRSPWHRCSAEGGEHRSNSRSKRLPGIAGSKPSPQPENVNFHRIIKVLPHCSHTLCPARCTRFWAAMACFVIVGKGEPLYTCDFGGGASTVCSQRRGARACCCADGVCVLPGRCHVPAVRCAFVT